MRFNQDFEGLDENVEHLLVFRARKLNIKVDGFITHDHVKHKS